MGGYIIPLALLSAMLRFWSFSRAKYANGWDAYFYLVQVKSWIEEGRMHSADASLIYPLMRLIVWFCGGDYVLMYQVTAAFLAGLFTLAIGCLGKNTRRQMPVFLLVSWSVFSPHLSYFAAQYPKNLLGLVLLVFFMGALHGNDRMPNDRVIQSHPVIVFMLLLLNYFGHRFTFVLTVSYGLVWWFSNNKSRINESLSALKKSDGLVKVEWKMGGLISLVTAAMLVLFALLFPGLFHWADIGRLSGTFSYTPQFAPWSFVREFGIARLSFWWMAELIGLTLLFFTGVILILFQKSVVPPVSRRLYPLLLLLLFPFLEWSFTGIAYRAFLVWVLLCPLAIFCIPKKFELAAALCLLIAAFFSWKSYTPGLHDPDYARFKGITDRVGGYFEQHPVAATESLPELIICHNALAEFYTFSTGADALPWQPEYPVDSTRLWRLAAGISPQLLKYYVANEQPVVVVGPQYSLLPESLWQRAIRRATAIQDTAFLNIARSWYNPYRVRPGWLLKK